MLRNGTVVYGSMFLHQKAGEFCHQSEEAGVAMAWFRIRIVMYDMSCDLYIFIIIILPDRKKKEEVFFSWHSRRSEVSFCLTPNP